MGELYEWFIDSKFCENVPSPWPLMADNMINDMEEFLVSYVCADFKLYLTLFM